MTFVTHCTFSREGSRGTKRLGTCEKGERQVEFFVLYNAYAHTQQRGCSTDSHGRARVLVAHQVVVHTCSGSRSARYAAVCR